MPLLSPRRLAGLCAATLALGVADAHAAPTLVKQLALPDAPFDGIAVTPDGARLYVSLVKAKNPGLNTIAVVDTASLTVVALPTPGTLSITVSVAVTTAGAAARASAAAPGRCCSSGSRSFAVAADPPHLRENNRPARARPDRSPDSPGVEHRPDRMQVRDPRRKGEHAIRAHRVG